MPLISQASAANDGISKRDSSSSNLRERLIVGQGNEVMRDWEVAIHGRDDYVYGSDLTCRARRRFAAFHIASLPASADVA
ncbi:MAG: hypothetical protein J2P21_01535 [Chloracidobacterium sp.]|nr:hypothetical protein [Chloracidobacterium sp.]